MREKLRGDRDRQSDIDNDQVNLVGPCKTRDTDSLAVSIIVVDSNSSGSVERTLEAVNQQKFTDFETIVVRRPSREAKQSILKNRPETIVVKSQAELGFCRACNLAAQTALGKYLLFMDNNTWLHRAALGNLVEALESEPSVGVAGPLILNVNGTLHSIGMNINQFGRPLANRASFEADTEVIDNVFFVPGSVLMVEKQLFKTLNGFDELYVRGLEDADLCWRARLLGKKIVVNPWSIAYCEPGSGYEADDYLKYRNSLRMMIKNYSASRALVGSTEFFRATVVKSFKSLWSFEPRVFMQYWRALFWNLAILPDSIRQRRWVQRRRRLSDKSVLKHILVDDGKTNDFTSDRAA